MKQIARTTQILAAVLLLTFVPDVSSAANVFGTLGFGGGSSALWDGDLQGGLAVGGTITHRMDGPSISLRLAGVVTFTLLDSYEESVSEAAVMGGWDFFLPYSSSVAVRLGLGRISYHGGYANARSWDYEGHAWGPALQLDAYWKRIGVTYMIHTGGDKSFSSVLFCVKFGNHRG